jgi:hypothetical protein
MLCYIAFCKPSYVNNNLPAPNLNKPYRSVNGLLIFLATLSLISMLPKSNHSERSFCMSIKLKATLWLSDFFKWSVYALMAFGTLSKRHIAQVKFISKLIYKCFVLDIEVLLKTIGSI